MARVIVHTETGPRKVDASDVDDGKGDIAICQCGLSGEYPFCDGSHRATLDEPEGALFGYDAEGAERREVRIVDATPGAAEGDRSTRGDGGGTGDG